MKFAQLYLTLQSDSPDQNTGVGSLSFLQGIFPTHGLNPGLLHCRRILYQLSHNGNPRILEWVAFPFSSPGIDLPNPGIEPGSPALQVDSLPAKPQGKLKNTGMVAYPLSSRSSQPRNWTRVSCIAGGFLTSWAIREAANVTLNQQNSRDVINTPGWEHQQPRDFLSTL